MSVIVREARPAEFAAIGDLRVAAYRADGFLSDTSRYTQTLWGLGADGKGEILAAVEDTAVVGTAMLEFWPDGGPVVHGPEEAGIRALAVAPGAQGRGVGRTLVAAVTRRAAERGTRHLVLLTMPGMQAAQHLYTVAGFVRLPERDMYPRPGVALLAYGKTLVDA
ncbi:MAG TPA: GNAT family N-acetyltransferase [Streptosporangiaceae bacterium]